jgi:hypothetical protein
MNAVAGGSAAVAIFRKRSGSLLRESFLTIRRSRCPESVRGRSSVSNAVNFSSSVNVLHAVPVKGNPHAQQQGDNSRQDLFENGCVPFRKDALPNRQRSLWRRLLLVLRAPDGVPPPAFAKLLAVYLFSPVSALAEREIHNVLLHSFMPLADRADASVSCTRTWVLTLPSEQPIAAAVSATSISSQ